MDSVDEIRDYWDADAATYDRSSSHYPDTVLQRAAWRGALSTLLPAETGQRVLDVGAGTGFLSLMLSEMGHQVTAVDVSAQMLAQLQSNAAAANCSVTVVVGDATTVPPGPFDVAVSRHLLWLLRDPVAALLAWRAVVPGGRLVLVDSQWGRSADPIEKLRRVGRRSVSRWRRTPPAHHAELADHLRTQLPLGHGPSPAELLEAVHKAGWTAASLHRLDGVEWAMRDELVWPDRILGVTPRFAIVAGC
jgi:SAM-dependent methyltransferase